MNYSMHCPVEGCDHVMESSAENEDLAVQDLIVKGNEHFAEIGHEIDQSMTPEMQEQMTRQYMVKAE